MKRARRRIELDNRDWTKEPFITHKDLHDMSPWRVRQVLDARWVMDLTCMVYRNTTHPDNAEWWELEKMATKVAAARGLACST